MITDPWFYVAAVPAIAIVGLSKGGFLSGLSILGVPLLALIISPLQAAGIMLPILISMDAIGIWAYRKTFDAANLKVLAPATVLGIAIGWATAAYVSEAHVRLIVGIIACGFTLDYWLGLRPSRQGEAPNRLTGTVAATVAGFTSFVSHAGSPPVQMFLLPQRLPAMVYAGTMALLFAWINLVKVVPYFMLGQFSRENLSTTAALLPLAPLAMLAGIWLVRRLRQEPFYRIAYSCLFAVSLKLIWDGGRQVLGL
jgi:hypothetical protein